MLAFIDQATITLGIAIWGAVIATLVAAFDVYKHLRSGKPVLKMDISRPLISNDPREAGTRVIRVSVTNIGNTPVTLAGLSYRYFSDRPKNFKKPATERGLINTFRFPPVQEFPFLLAVGATWNHLVKLTPELERMAMEGFLYLEIEDNSQKSAYKFARGQVVV